MYHVWWFTSQFGFYPRPSYLQYLPSNPHFYLKALRWQGCCWSFVQTPIRQGEVNCHLFWYLNACWQEPSQLGILNQENRKNKRKNCKDCDVGTSSYVIADYNHQAVWTWEQRIARQTLLAKHHWCLPPQLEICAAAKLCWKLERVWQMKTTRLAKRSYNHVLVAVESAQPKSRLILVKHFQFTYSLHREDSSQCIFTYI